MAKWMESPLVGGGDGGGGDTRLHTVVREVCLCAFCFSVYPLNMRWCLCERELVCVGMCVYTRARVGVCVCVCVLVRVCVCVHV